MALELRLLRDVPPDPGDPAAVPDGDGVVASMAIRADRDRGVAAALMVLAAILTPGPVETDSSTIAIDNPTGIEALRDRVDRLGERRGRPGACGLGARIGGCRGGALPPRRRRAAPADPLAGYASERRVAVPSGGDLHLSVSSLVSSIAFYGFFALDRGRHTHRDRIRDPSLPPVRHRPGREEGRDVLAGCPVPDRSVSGHSWRSRPWATSSRLVFGLVLVALTFRPVLQAARSVADRIVYGRPCEPVRGAQRVLRSGCRRRTPPRTSCRAWRRSSKERPVRSGRDVWLIVRRLTARAGVMAPRTRPSSHGRPPLARRCPSSRGHSPPRCDIKASCSARSPSRCRRTIRSTPRGNAWYAISRRRPGPCSRTCG